MGCSMYFEYIDKIRELLDIVEKEEAEAMGRAVDALVDAVVKRKAIFCFGASHAGILAQELYCRAGGLVTVNPVFPRSLMLDTMPFMVTSNMEKLVGYGKEVAKVTPMKAGDVVIVHSVSGRNPVGIEFALEAKARGAYVICLTNLVFSKSAGSRHPSGKHLYEIADLVLDNHGITGDGCVEIAGHDQKVGPTSTVIGAAILNAIIAETAKKLAELKVEPLPVFGSANVDPYPGQITDEELIDAYKDMIHYRYDF